MPITSSRRPGLPFKSLVKNAASPEVAGAIITADWSAIVISFDVSIKERANSTCESIFASETLQLLGTDPECRFRTSAIKVMLGEGDTLKDGAEIAFKADNGIVFVGANRRFASQVTGKRFSLAAQNANRPTDTDAVGISNVLVKCLRQYSRC